MRTVLVTVEHPYGVADMEVPAEVVVGDLLPALMEACAIPQARVGDLGGGQWALGSPEGGAFPVGRGLADCGVVDGMRLVLLDSYGWQSRASHVDASPVPADIVSSTQTGGIGVRWRRDI